MKVLKPALVVPVFSKEITCNNCDAVLLVEEADLIITDSQRDGWDAGVTCPECHKGFSLTTDLTSAQRKAIDRRRREGKSS